MQDGAAASVTPVWALSQATVRDQILIRLLQLTSQRLSLHSGSHISSSFAHDKCV